MLDIVRNGFVSALVLLVLGAAHGEGKWDLIKDKDGIRVYTRDVQGAGIKEVKTVGTMKTTVDRLIEIQFDIEHQTKWIPLCKSAKLLKEVNAADRQVYREIDNPWPFQDRDYVVELVLHREDGTGEATVAYQEVADAYPRQDCCVRMERLRGYWKFIPLAGGLVEVTHQMHFHPGGESPTAFINMSMGMIGRDAFTALRDFAQQEK